MTSNTDQAFKVAAELLDPPAHSRCIWSFDDHGTLDLPELFITDALEAQAVVHMNRLLDARANLEKKKAELKHALVEVEVHEHAVANFTKAVGERGGRSIVIRSQPGVQNGRLKAVLSGQDGEL